MISISVNGVPLAVYVDEKINDEITAHRKAEVGLSIPMGENHASYK